MRKVLITLALLASTSIPAFAGVHPDVNWLDAHPPKAEKQEPTKQADQAFTEPTAFNLLGTRLNITVPEGWVWKSGQAAFCCKDDTARASFNFWVEKHEEADDNVRTQFGFQKVEKDPTRKANLMKSWNKRVHEDMAKLDESLHVKSNGLVTDIVTVGEGIRALAANWFIINEHGATFNFVQFEIWDGGQRDLVQLFSLVEGTDSDKDPNHQMVLSMAQSLKFARTEANPVWEKD